MRTDGTALDPASPARSGRFRGFVRRHRQVLVLAATACFVEALYWFLSTAGHVTGWPHYYVTYLNDLADGFRQGHLHMAIEPAPQLLARANPLSGENRDLWYWDASLYRGHYYLYWGPVPALLLAAAKTLLRVHTVVYDEVVVFGLASLQLGAATWIIGRTARSIFDQPPLVLQVAAVLVVGLANPTPYNLGRGAVYEAAIVGGQAFLLLGVACLAESVARPGRGTRWRVAGGVAWALAVGCRASVAPAIALLALVTAALDAGPAASLATRLRRVLSGALPVAVPLVLGVFALLLYNRLRFDAWLEFGRQFQLTWIAAPVAARYIPPNLYSYLLRSPALSCRFPYVFALAGLGDRAFPPGHVLPAGYFVYEQVAGVLPVMPWSWAAPIAWAAALREWRRRRGLSWALTSRAWAVWALTAVGTVSLLAPVMVASATNRYLGDAVGGIALTGAFGIWIAHRAARPHPARARAVVAGAWAVAVLSCAAGLALGFYGQYVHFPANNPSLADKLVQGLSVCGPVVPPPPN